RSTHATSWIREDFEDYVHYLDKRPLAIYALHYLKSHIDGSRQDQSLQVIVSQFLDKLAKSPANHLLRGWAVSCLESGCSSSEQIATAEDFRHKLLHVAARGRYATAAEIMLAAGVNVNT